MYTHMHVHVHTREHKHTHTYTQPEIAQLKHMLKQWQDDISVFTEVCI